eukprot:TRINITY_DN371_c0_g2_i3.p1 TRINITY_DN371_c0_g2~~TRINITY_DN371_c0_g2_i3.p1  ORF type:complete len:299 (-),score=61.41 TRINITY_DN371_c0_g2_i3:538-1434(-)
MHATPLHTCRMGFCGEIWPFFRPSFGNMTQYLEDNNLDYNSVLGIIPTGWADSSNWNKRHAREEKGNAAVQLIPYSEHSNYTELVEFVTFLKPRLVIPTVFSDENDRKAIIRRFAPLLDHNANKRAFFASMAADKGSFTASEAASTASGEQMPHLPRNEQDLVDNASSTDEDVCIVEHITAVTTSSTATASAYWECTACTYRHHHHEASYLQCSMCGAARHHDPQHQQTALDAAKPQPSPRDSSTPDRVQLPKRANSAGSSSAGAASPVSGSSAKKARAQPKIASFFALRHGSGSGMD